MQETLDSQGWKYILDVFLSDAANKRKRIFSMSNKDELVSELESLRLLRTSLGRVYSEAEYQLPEKAAAVFQ